MEHITNFIILLFFLIEVVVLLKLEKVLWGTYYTPLNFLMVPYTVVLLITVSLPASLEFVPFYYPSILFWSVGLILYFLPSFLIGLIYRGNEVKKITFTDPSGYTSAYLLGGFCLMASLLYLFFYSKGADEMIGSEEFASETLKGGLWAHIRQALLALLIILIFFFKRHKFIFYFLIAGIVLVAIVYQVLSWIVIPIAAGFIMRLYANRSRLKLRYLLYVVVFGVVLFFLSYYLVLVFAVDEGEMNIEILESIYKHFYHYLVSGVLGFSMDLQYGVLEQANPQSIFAPFINIFYVFSGNDLVSPINPVYLDTGWTVTNVRTFFGTLYVNLGTLGSIVYVLVHSCIMYGVLLWLKFKSSIWALSFYGLMCALLFMGWFEFYFFHLTIIEIPIFSFVYITLLYKLNIREDIKFLNSKEKLYSV